MLGLIRRRYQQVETDHRDVQRPGCLDRGIGQGGVEDGGDVLEAAAGMQIGGLAHRQALPDRQDAVVVDARRMQGAQGFRILGNPALATGGGLAPAALGIDQVADAVAAVAQHLGGAADGRGDHFVADHQDAQVAARVEAFQQHATVEHPGALDGFLDFAGGAQVDRDALALLAVHRLDHQASVFGEEGCVLLGAAGQALGRQAQAGALEGAVGQALVLAQGHAHGAGQVGQRFAATDAATAVVQGEQAGLGIIDLHLDAAAQGFVDNDLGVGVELRLRAGADEQRLVDAVLALDAEGLQFAKAQLGVQALGLAVVVQYGKIKITEPTAHEVLDQVAHQHFADTRAAAVRVDRQAPEAAAVLGVLEGLLMIEAHDAADHRAAVFVLRQPVNRATLVARGELVRIDRQHAAHLVQAVDRLPVIGILRPAHAVAAKAAARLAVVAEPQAQGIRGVEKQLLRCLGQHLLGGGDIQGDIALAAALGQQLLGQHGRVREGMTDQQATPAAMHGQGLAGLAAALFGEARLQPLVGGRLAALQALIEGGGSHWRVSLAARIARPDAGS